MNPDLVLRQAIPWMHNQAEVNAVDIVIEDGKIVTVTRNFEGSGRRELQLDGRLTLPGLVNMHTHLDKAFMGHHAEENYDIFAALAKWSEVKDDFTKDGIKERAFEFIRLAILSGTTLLRTCVDIGTDVGLDGVEALLEVREACQGKIDLQLMAFPQGKFVDAPGSDELMREAMRMGVDIVGGRPHTDQDHKAHIDQIFEIAREFDCDIDMSVDAIVPVEDFDPNTLDMKYYAKKAVEEDYVGRVTSHHALGLSSVDAEPAAEIIELVAKAQMNVITNPSSNLYTEGRKDRKRPRRGLTRVKELLEGGVNVVLGTDNLDDVFMPHINTDILREAYVAIGASHLGTRKELRMLLNAVTYGGAVAAGVGEEYGIAEGKRADLVVLDTKEPLEAITRQPTKLYVIKEGEIIVINRPAVEYLAGI